MSRLTQSIPSGFWKNLMVIINVPAHGTDETFNGVPLAIALSGRNDATARVFLMGDAVTRAVSGQKTADGY